MAKEFYKNNQAKTNRDKEAAQEAAPLPCNADGTVTTVGVNFRNAGKVYSFHPGELALKEGDRVIVETSRGIEMGTVKVANRDLPANKVNAPLKSVIRRATAEDIEREERNRDLERDAALICKKKIAAHKLGMKLVAAEYTFDNAKLIFYFTCESRVDFRDLVKDLAATFRTRIELRQIGIRDEAKLMGGIGSCGRKFCCSGFLTDFVQVSIKMAKEQNFSLNSAKVSGVCGRLMCCLSYEHKTYEDALKVTPPTGSLVRTPDGDGVIVETRPLSAEVKVKIAEKDKEKELQKIYSCEQITVLRLPAKKEDKKQRAANSAKEVDEENADLLEADAVSEEL